MDRPTDDFACSRISSHGCLKDVKDGLLRNTRCLSSPAGPRRIHPRGDSAELALGVTTVHDPSNDTATVFAAAELARAGAVGPPGAQFSYHLPRVDFEFKLNLRVVEDEHGWELHFPRRGSRFLAKAVSRNLPVTFANHHSAPHFFDVMDDSDTSRQIIRQVLEFMQFHLLG